MKSFETPPPLRSAKLEASIVPLPPKFKKRIIERCGPKVTGDGIECPYCGALEAYKDATDPKNTDKWFFAIRAFRVDNASECTICKKWFE